MFPRQRTSSLALLALLFCLSLFSGPSSAARNLLDAGADWKRLSWKSHGVAERDVAVHAGSGPVFRLSDDAFNDIRLVRRVRVKAGAFYRFSARVRTEDVVGKVGANLSIDGTYNRSRIHLSGTTGWTRVEQVFRATEDDRLAFALRLGYWNATARGTAWFDRVELEELETWQGDYEPVRRSAPQPKVTTAPLRLLALLFLVPFVYGGLAWLRRNPAGSAVPVAGTRPPCRQAGIWVLLAGGLAVRLLFVGQPGPWVEPPAFEAWALYLAGFFAQGSGAPPAGVLAPAPLWLYWLGLAGSVVKGLVLENSRLFTVLLQLPAITVELVVLAYALVFLRPRLTAGVFWPAAALLAFHPGLLLATALAGMPAALAAGLVLLSLSVVRGAGPVVSGLLLGLAIAAAPGMVWLALPVTLWSWLRLGGGATGRLFLAAVTALVLAVAPVLQFYTGDQVLAMVAGLPGGPREGVAAGLPWTIFGAVVYLAAVVLVFARRSIRDGIRAAATPAGRGTQAVFLLQGLLATTLTVMAVVTGPDAALLYLAVVVSGLLLAERSAWRWTFFLLGVLASWDWGYGYFYASLAGTPPLADSPVPVLVRSGIAALAVLSWWATLRPASVVRAGSHWRDVVDRLTARANGLVRLQPARPEPAFRVTWGDIVLLVAIWGADLFLIAHDMGEHIYPLNAYQVEAPEEVFVATFPRPVGLQEVRVYTGANGYGEVRFEVEGKEGWEPLWRADGGRLRYKGGQRERRSTFKQLWRRVEADRPVARVRLTLSGAGLDINEIVFFGDDQEIRIPQTLEPKAPAGPPVAASTHPLFDEGHRITAEKTYRAKTFWDEVYYARSAYELANGLTPYEKSHPPLGKVLIAWGVDAFGMTPFGWRFMDACSVALLPVLLWVAARGMFGSRFAAYAAAFLAVFESMFFIHGRWANIDTFLVFFLTVSLLSLLRWYRAGHGRFNRGNVGWFVTAGVFFGCAVATKWSALFTGFAVFVLWVIAQASTIANTVERPASVRRAGLARYLRAELPANLAAWGAVFVVLPALIYYFSYAGFLATLPGAPGPLSPEGWQAFVDQQLFQWSFHADKETGHRSSSMFYTWPVMLQPASMLTLGGVPKGTTATLNILGNPVIWWTGLAAMLVLGWRALLGRDEIAVFLAGIYFLQGLPWLLVSRTTYLYHYYPFLPLLILGIVYWLARLDTGRRSVQAAVAVFAFLVVAGFAAWYPYVTGMPVPVAYTEAVRIFDTWSRL